MGIKPPHQNEFFCAGHKVGPRRNSRTTQRLRGPRAVRPQLDACLNMKIQSLFCMELPKEIGPVCLRSSSTRRGIAAAAHGTEACRIAISQGAQRAMEYPEQYKEQLLT